VFFYFFYQPSTIRGWTSAFRLLDDHRLRGVIEGRLRHFLPRWLSTGWPSVISQRKTPWNTLPGLGIEPGPQGGQTVSYPTELSCKMAEMHTPFNTHVRKWLLLQWQQHPTGQGLPDLKRPVSAMGLKNTPHG